MKVKNRAIGSVGELVAHGAGKYITEFAVESEDGSEIATYDTIDELQKYWVTYKPTEPEITSPEWRHVVRKWYELNGLEGKLRVMVDHMNYRIIGWRKDEKFYGQEIGIPLSAMECDKDIRSSFHAIDELCGAPEPLEPTFIDLDERIKEKEEE